MYFHGTGETRAELEGLDLVPVLPLANCDLGKPYHPQRLQSPHLQNEDELDEL